MENERYKKGLAEMRKHLGDDTDKYIANIEQMSEKFARVNVEFAFGDLYTDNILDEHVRELITIAALTVQGSSLPELKVHIKSALRCGASRAEIVEVITQMLAYCGFPVATNALLTAKEIFTEIDDNPSN